MGAESVIAASRGPAAGGQSRRGFAAPMGFLGGGII